MDGGDDQRRTALATFNGDPRHVIDRHQQILGFGSGNEADRHADDQRRAHAFFADQADQFDQRGRRVADADDGAVQLAEPVRLAHGLHGARAVGGLGGLDHVGVGNVVVGAQAEVGQARLGEADADHLDIGDDGRTALQHCMHAGLHGIRVEGGQAVELEIGVGVDHPANQRPLLGGVGVRAGFGVDDGEGVVLDGAAGFGQLFGNGVAGGGDGHGFPRESVVWV